jgi:hypothetical protein
MSTATDLLASGLGSLRRLGLALVVVGLAVLAVVAAGPSAATPVPAPGLVVVGSTSAAVPQYGAP